MKQPYIIRVICTSFLQAIRMLIRWYQYLISPLIGPCCRFHPSCSEYALLAIEYYGLGKGLWLALLRLLRCHPWSEGGYDPILPKKEMM